jgi:N-acetylmuramoyl-L-alanine amidase
MSILALPSAPREVVMGNLPDTVASAVFRDDMFPNLWDVALAYGIDPVGMVAQSGKETGWGTFGGQVSTEFHNTCGLKLHVSQQALFPGVTDDDHPLAHAMFANWHAGAHAHAQHLRAYTGTPVHGLIIDPRYTLVGPPAVVTWAELGGRWAPSATYGLEIEELMVRLST